MDPKIQWDIAELYGLLDGLEWNTYDGMIRESDSLAVMIDPLPVGAEDAFDVPVTVLPLTVPVETLAGTCITLAPVAATAGPAHYFGVLDRRGQLLFRALPAHRYRTGVKARTKTSLTAERAPGSVDPLLIPWPSLVTLDMPWRSCMSARTGDSEADQAPQCVFRDASGLMVATVWSPDPETVEIQLEVKNPSWDGRLMALTFAETDRHLDASLSDPQLRLVPLAWSNASRACVGAVRLSRRQGAPSLSVGLQLPDRPWPITGLTSDLADVVTRSIDEAASDMTVSSWQRLVDSQPDLPVDIREIVRAALSSKSRALSH